MFVCVSVCARACVSERKRVRGGGGKGAKESTCEWEPLAFEVGIWPRHLHLMPFRLLVLTRAKHLTRLGLI